MLIFLLYVGLLVGVLAVYKDAIKRDVNNLGFQMIGYYVLASLPFRLFWLPIPFGFLICLFLLSKPMLRYKKQKQVASLLGFIVFIVDALF
ncbi:MULTISPECIES: hypothetical protein [Bacillaceae]|uniref:hypothetical protein n=1 Tax=Bacillaceae TaxID=186817 RepID=UPI000BFDE77E|nr:hypothetical protein [Bacillus sp. AFS053548]PGM58405.1 hypothetical protein CN946_04915 [Bacillus sp. AFS053548]